MTLLETEYGWNGIVAEPARRWHADLERNRRCHISKDCVWSSTGHRVPFRETRLLELSTMSSFADDDCAAHLRKVFSECEVDTVSLLDLLDRF